MRSKWLVLITGIRGMSFLRLSKGEVSGIYLTAYPASLIVLSASAATINFSRRCVLFLFPKLIIKLHVFVRAAQTTFCNLSFISHVDRSCYQTFPGSECKVIPQV